MCILLKILMWLVIAVLLAVLAILTTYFAILVKHELRWRQVADERFSPLDDDVKA